MAHVQIPPLRHLTQHHRSLEYGHHRDVHSDWRRDLVADSMLRMAREQPSPLIGARIRTPQPSGSEERRYAASFVDRPAPKFPDTIVFSLPSIASLRARPSSRPMDHDSVKARHSPQFTYRRAIVLKHTDTGYHSPTSVHEFSQPTRYELDHKHAKLKAKPRSSTSRYLREVDRRAIIARLDRGEKQCELATEFNVCRSTICNLYKQREQILARLDENPYSRHPKARTTSETSSSPRS